MTTNRSWILGLFLLASCSGNDAEPVPAPTLESDNAALAPYLELDLAALPSYAASYPAHYTPAVQAANNSASANPVTDIGATLGRVLFYDKRMSVNNTISCASCHAQGIGFTDSERFSTGFEGGQTAMRSMRLANAAFYEGRSMFWDKRASSIEDQSTRPIQDGVEMGFDEAHGGFEALIEKMQALPYYPVLFRRAFGDESITEARAQQALGQFIRGMVSVNSRFDAGAAQVFNAGQPGAGVGNPFPNFSDQENLGKALFLQPPNAGGAGCAGCHRPPTFALDPNSRSNGLDAGETTVFKSPSLKGVAQAGAYMHDGRLATLEDVVEHYNSGVQTGPALDPRLALPGGNPLRLNLSEADKQALVAFLRTLSDNVLGADERFADPFK
jgi:cytochrome c peroxidase